MCKQWGVTTVSWEKDGDGYAKGRDGRVREVLGECGVEVIERSGRTLWDCESIVKANGGQPTMTIAQLRKVSGCSLLCPYTARERGEILLFEGLYAPTL